MDDSLAANIEKIKLQEKVKDAQLKEKRELETTLVSLNKTILETKRQIEIICQMTVETTAKVNSLTAQLEIAKLRKNALSQYIEDGKNTLAEFRQKIVNGHNDISQLQTQLCDSVHGLTDECDIWALLNKPKNMGPINVKPVQMIDSVNFDKLANEQRLQEALERKKRAILERDRLLSEPDTGEEFLRSIQIVRKNCRKFCSKTVFDENEPIKFSTSPASRPGVVVPVKAAQTTMPWYQPYVVSGSVAIFLLYFCVLREENDMDQSLGKTLYQHIDGLEKHQLIMSYKFNIEHGKSVEAIEKRLKEIEEMERSKAVA